MGSCFWIGAVWAPSAFKRLITGTITVTSLIHGNQMPEYITGCSADFTLQDEFGINGGPDGERKHDAHGIVPLGIPLGFPVPGGSSTSVHVAPHTDLYSRSHSLMHAVAVPKGVCWSCCRAAPP